MYNSNLFATRKGIHIKLSKEIHAELRAECFRRGLSMQEVFDELAYLVVCRDSKMNSILDHIIVKKTKNKLKTIADTSNKKMNDADKDLLFELINQQSENNKLEIDAKDKK